MRPAGPLPAPPVLGWKADCAGVASLPGREAGSGRRAVRLALKGKAGDSGKGGPAGSEALPGKAGDSGAQGPRAALSGSDARR